MDVLNKAKNENNTRKSKKDSNEQKSASRKASRSKSRHLKKEYNKRPALVVQKLPPPMLLPP